MDLAVILSVLDATIRLSTPLLLACLAGMYSERAGLFDIGLEGKMLAAAFAAGAVAAISGSAWLGLLAGMIVSLGTSLLQGVINAFVGIASTGSGGIGAVSAGISEALVETALGLFVAIPAVWFYNYLTSRLEYFNVEMDNSSSELVDYFIKKTA